jgi:DNA-directed RNA polymerase specialized sigma subunit
MIKNENAYKRTLAMLNQQEELIQSEINRFRELNLSEKQIEVALEPLNTYYDQLEKDIEEYQNLIDGRFPPMKNLPDIGRALIYLRIYKGITQSELAARLNVAVSSVSRDESNEYYGSRFEKIVSVFEALGVTPTLYFDLGIDAQRSVDEK